MLYDVLGFFSMLESIVGFALMSASVIRFREPVKKRITIGLILMICVRILFFCMYVIGAGEPTVGFAVIIILVVDFAWFLICSKDVVYISVFNFLTFVNIYIAISYISNMLTLHSNGVEHMIKYIIIRTIIYGAIILLMFKFVRPRFRQLVEALDKEWRDATLVPLVFLILQIFLIYYPVPYWSWDSNSWYDVITIIVYVLFLAVYYLIYIQANGIVEKYSLEKKQLIMAQQDKLWESEIARQKVATTLTFQQRHDMHHHNAVIIGMLQSGGTEELKNYMQKIDATLDAQNVNFFCSNPIVNSIFNDYASRAEEKGIKTEFRVSVPEGIGIENIDLTCVLGNTLENALEGCLRLSKDDKKEIIVITKFIDNRLRVQVENTCRADIAFEGDLPITQKQSGGTGTKSIIYTAERYDGTAGFSVMDGKFITQIVLNAN